MNQDHVMSLLQATQKFMIDSETYIIKRLNKITIPDHIKQTLLTDLQSVRMVPKIAVLSVLTEKDLAILIRRICEDVMAFKEYMDSINAFLLKRLSLHEEIMETRSKRFAQQPLYLKPISCFKASVDLLIELRRYKQIYDTLKSLAVIDNNLDIVDNELCVFSINTEDYAHFSRIINSNIRNINKESYYNISRLNKALKIKCDPDNLRREFYIEDYHFNRCDNHDFEKIFIMIEHYIKVVEEMAANLLGIEDKLVTLENLHIENLEFITTAHKEKSFPSQMFYSFTYLESKRKKIRTLSKLRIAISFNRLNRNRLSHLIVLLQKSLVELREKIAAANNNRDYLV